MKIEQTPIIKIKPKQKKLEMQKQNEEGQQIDFASNGESFEERQKVEGENSEQVLPAQINKLETMEKLVAHTTTSRLIIAKMKILQQKMYMAITKHQTKVRP